MPNIFINPRATIPILISAFNILTYIVFALAIYLKDKKYNKLAVIHTILTFTSLLLYRSALGRSDLTHVETSSSFIFIVLGLNLGLYLTIINTNTKVLRFILLLLIIIDTSFIGKSYISRNPRNIFSFVQNTYQYVHLDNNAFINKDNQDGILRLKEIFKDESCIMNFTSQAVIPYLLDKPSCGRLYISYFASAEPVREEFFSTIREDAPQYILYSSKSWTYNLDNITNYQRFPNIMQYIDNKYEYFELVSDYWVVYKLVRTS